MIDFLDTVSQNLMDQNFRIGRWSEGLVNLVYHFAIPEGTLHGNQLKSQNQRFSRTNLYHHASISKRIAISWFQFQKIKWHEFFCTVYNFGEILSSNLIVYTVKKDKFCHDTAEIGILRQISQNILNRSLLTLQVYRRIDEDDYPDIHLAVAQGTLLWQPVKFGRCSQTVSYTHLTLPTILRV